MHKRIERAKLRTLPCASACAFNCCKATSPRHRRQSGVPFAPSVGASGTLLVDAVAVATELEEDDDDTLGVRAEVGAEAAAVEAVMEAKTESAAGRTMGAAAAFALLRDAAARRAASFCDQKSSGGGGIRTNAVIY